MLKFHFSFSCGSLDFAFLILVQVCWHDDGLQWAVKSLILAVWFNGQIFLHRCPCCLLNLESCLQISQSFSHGTEAENFSWYEQCIFCAIRGIMWTRHRLFMKHSSMTYQQWTDLFQKVSNNRGGDLYGIRWLWLGVWSVWPLGVWVLLLIEWWW